MHRITESFFRGWLYIFFLVGFFYLRPIQAFTRENNRDIKQRTVIICTRKPFSKQVIRSNTRYVISGTIDLKGETVNLLENTRLIFKNGVICNGKLQGDYIIDSESKRIFDNVDISSYQHPIKISWLVGDRTLLNVKDFQGLPNVEVDFESIPFIINETIILDDNQSVNFKNLYLKTNNSIRYWSSASTCGICSPIGDKNFINSVKVSNEVSEKYEGYVIEISTADETIFDSRPNEKGIPTLYKGITSRILSVDGDKILLADSLERFSIERTYSKQSVKSTYVIYKPRAYKLKNCHFVFTGKDGLSFNGSDFLIEDCSFEAQEGSNALLSLGGYSGCVRNCLFKGAYYSGTGTSYGIQVNKGSHIVIENSEFYENRRGVDFSGSFESRYNIVRNCSFYQEKNIGETGSAIGGHSTSYGNIYRNNRIYGDYQIGIQCRGENEIIDGNLFECFAIWMVGYGYNTTIINNKVVPISDFSTGVFAGSDIEKEGNCLTLYNNNIDVRAILIVGSKKIRYKLCNNYIRFNPNTSTQIPVLFSDTPIDYEMSGNIIKCSNNDVKVKLLDGIDLPSRDNIKKSF